MTAALTRRNFRVLRSFDLRAALTAPTACKCPYHGASRCACQFVVLLVYGDAPEPVVVTAYSRNGEALVRLVHNALTRPDSYLARQVIAALKEAALPRPVAAVHTGAVVVHLSVF